MVAFGNLWGERKVEIGMVNRWSEMNKRGTYLGTLQRIIAKTSRGCDVIVQYE